MEITEYNELVRALEFVHGKQTHKSFSVKFYPEIVNFLNYLKNWREQSKKRIKMDKRKLVYTVNKNILFGRLE